MPFLSLRTARRTALVATGIAAALTAPAAASAASASLGNGTLSITDQPGHVGVYTVSQLSNPLHITSLDKVIVTANTQISGAPVGCVNPITSLIPDPTTLICQRAALNKLSFDLGDGDDSVTRPFNLTILGAQALPLGDLPVAIDGGAGNDHLEGGDAADVITGGAGDDHLYGFGGNDTLTGGLGADWVEPGAGTNTIDTSTPEADTVSVLRGSVNAATASPNDVFVGSGATTSITLLGVDVGLGGLGSGGTPDPRTTGLDVNVDGNSSSTGGTSASVDVNAGTAGGAGIGVNASVSVGIPSVDDLLGGVRGDLAGGSVPAGVTLPPVLSLKITNGLAGRVKTDDGIPTALPPGIVFNPDGLHIRVTCTTACDALGSGVVDLGGGTVFKMLPSTVSLPAKSAGQSAGQRTATINLGIHPHEYIAIQSILDQAKCAVIGTRVRVKTEAGDEVRSYALPICGAKLTFRAKSHPIATADKVSGVITSEATCSSNCDIVSRFLLVKSGNTTIARVNRAKIAAVRDSSRVHTLSYKLSARQQDTIMRVIRGGHTSIRYVVSAKATSGGVATTGSTTFRANVH